jgi:hypothetical protein
MREKVSAPITSARLAWPCLEEVVGRRQREDEARAHRLHVEGAPCLMPSRSGCDRVAGKVWSGRRGREHDQVDRLRIDAGVGERGLRRLGAEMGGELALGAMWRWRMPVRWTIQSSEVSTFPRKLGIGQTWLGR